MTRLLLIEDDNEVREALRLSLEDEGYDVIEAINGMTGLSGAEKFTPDVVLIDLRLPDISGFEVCRRIRTKIEDDPDHPVHILTIRGLGYKLQA